MGVNLRARSFDNNLRTLVNEYSDLPIEIKRVILNGVLDRINLEADLVVQHELKEFEQEQDKNKE